MRARGTRVDTMTNVGAYGLVGLGAVSTAVAVPTWRAGAGAVRVGKRELRRFDPRAVEPLLVALRQSPGTRHRGSWTKSIDAMRTAIVSPNAPVAHGLAPAEPLIRAAVERGAQVFHGGRVGANVHGVLLLAGGVATAAVGAGMLVGVPR